MKMLRYVVFCCFMVLACAGVSARTIAGVVLSEADSAAVTGAAVRLMHPDGSMVEGTLTGSDGRFALETSESGRLKLDVLLTGYSGPDIHIAEGRKSVELGTIYLTEGVGLDEVTVSAGTRFQSKGNTIILPSAADVKASSTALSLLQKLVLPGLDANPITRSISVDGGSPKLLIDGVPSTLADFNVLNPKDIARIEYSRVTPARWADSGAKGMIKITLKKRGDGGQVYMEGQSALTTAVVDAYMRLSYHQGPSQFAINYSPSWRNYTKVYDSSKSSYIGDDFRVDMDKFERSPFNYITNNLTLRYNYKPSERTLFSATFGLSTNRSKHRLTGEATDSWAGDYASFFLSHDKLVAPSLDLFLRHDFNDRNSLEVQVVGTLSNNDYDFLNRYDYTAGTTDSYLTDVEGRRRSLISAVSYVHTFDERTSLSCGYQNTVSHNTNTYRDSGVRPVLTENNNYVYARVSRQQGNVYLTVSSGVKLYWVDNADNRRHFVRNLTSMLFSWDFLKRWNLQGSFEYTPSIPSLASLTDHRQQTSPYLYHNGNPYLKTAESFDYRLLLTYQRDKFTVSLGGGYTDINNATIGNVIYLGDRKFLSQPVNIDRNNTLLGALNIGFSDVAGFGANASIHVKRTEVRGDGWRHDLTSAGADLSVWWNKGPWTIGYWQSFPSKSLYGHGLTRGEIGNALSVEFKPDDHWVFGAKCLYLFSKNGSSYLSKGLSEVNPNVSLRRFKSDRNMIMLSVRYTADFGSIFRTGQRSLNNSDKGSSIMKIE